ncbi:MAG: hypothetical protein AAF501_01280 [Pseudomonadota bacterium]
MTRHIWMLRLGALILLVAGGIGLGAALDPLVSREMLGIIASLVSDAPAAGWILSAVIEALIALGLDFALSVVIVSGQILIGVPVAILGLMSAPRVTARICELLVSLTMPVLAVALISLWRAVPGSAGAVEMLPLTLVPPVLILAGAPLTALTLIRCVTAELATPWYVASRELGLSSVRAFGRHIWPALEMPLMRMAASLGLQTFALLLALGAFDPAWLGIEPNLGGLLRRAFDGLHAMSLPAILAPCIAISTLLLGLGLLRRGAGS